MGLITIKTAGSFGDSERTITASDHGHSHCVNKAMIYLQDIMRKAINLDHKLQKEGVEPDQGFTIDKI